MQYAVVLTVWGKGVGANKSTDITQFNLDDDLHIMHVNVFVEKALILNHEYYKLQEHTGGQKFEHVSEASH